MLRRVLGGRKRWMAWLVAAAVSGVLVQTALAQQEDAGRGRPPVGRGMAGRRPYPRGPFSPPGRRGRPGGAAQQNMVDHLLSLPPEEQKEFMRHNPRFQNLPPEQQANIQRHLERFNSLPLEKREALRERYELFRQLPPEQQDRARALFRQWNQYRLERRHELRREFRQLREAPPEERRRRMESDEFRNRYSEREQEMLRGLVALLPPPA